MEHLVHLRDKWKDEIPDRVIHSSDNDNKFKVRRNWFQAVVGTVESLVDTGQIKGSTKLRAANELMDTFTAEEFIQQDLTTPGDINNANRLIDIILNR